MFAFFRAIFRISNQITAILSFLNIKRCHIGSRAVTKRSQPAGSGFRRTEAMTLQQKVLLYQLSKKRQCNKKIKKVNKILRKFTNKKAVPGIQDGFFVRSER